MSSQKELRQRWGQSFSVSPLKAKAHCRNIHPHRAAEVLVPHRALHLAALLDGTILDTIKRLLWALWPVSGSQSAVPRPGT